SADVCFSAASGEQRTFKRALIRVVHFMSTRPSVPIPKFASLCGTLSCALRNQRDTSKSLILVPLLNPKFASRIRGEGARTSGSRHEPAGPSDPGAHH